jgi:two-component system, response regulator
MDEKRILLVEDNPDDVELALRAVRQANLSNDVIVLHDGAEALDYLFGIGTYQGRDLRLMPALVLLDLKLPQVSGLDVLRRLRANARTQLLPIVILTASRESQDVSAAYQLGVNSYICKPVTFDHFADVVKQVVHYWLSVNERLRTEELPKP